MKSGFVKIYVITNTNKCYVKKTDKGYIQYSLNQYFPEEEPIVLTFEEEMEIVEQPVYQIKKFFYSKLYNLCNAINIS